MEDLVLGILSRTDYVINHWFTVAWVTLATIYTYYAVIKDIIDARKAKQE